MPCLVHDARYRSSFHAVSNELRKENRIPVSILRTMPHKCCTCNDDNNLVLVSVLIHEKDGLVKLKNLIDQIDREKQSNPKLVLALNRLENFIKENRSLAIPLPSTSHVDDEMEEDHQSNKKSLSDDESEDNIDDASSSSSEDIIPKRKKKPISKTTSKKPSKPLKKGTFLFLSYKFEDTETSNASIEAAKTLQRGRFIGRINYISALERLHNVYINMITPKTSEQILKTLQNAKNGIGSVKIHNAKDLPAAGEDNEEKGVWILIRPKKNSEQTEITGYGALLAELTARWESHGDVKKRKNPDEDEDEEQPNKK